MSTVLDIAPLAGSKLEVPVEVPDSLQILEGTEQPGPGRHAFRILHFEHGDQRICWHSDSLTEISDARKLFDELRGQGLTPYKVGLDGKKSSEVMEEFDPTAEEIIFLPTKLVTGG